KTQRRTRLLFSPADKPWSLIDDPEREGQGFNLWRGFVFEPKPGNIDPYRELLDRCYGKNIAELKLYEHWVGLPLQEPGTKSKYAIVIRSDEQGSGKSTMGLIIAALHG